VREGKKRGEKRTRPQPSVEQAGARCTAVRGKGKKKKKKNGERMVLNSLAKIARTHLPREKKACSVISVSRKREGG